MATVYETIRDICLGLPETEEVISHSFPTYKAAGKAFATFSVNHHGDEKVALLLNIGKDMQTMLVESAPAIFFVPPYSGPQGWVGIELNKGLAWDRVGELTVDTYRRVAPAALSKTLQPIKITTIPDEMTAEQINPLRTKTNLALLSKIKKIGLTFPETTMDSQFGNPCVRAGKKSFCCLHLRDGKPQLQLWVGTDRQAALTTFDDRFSIPPYVGHNGWIDLRLNQKQNWQEINDLLLISYKHFALKRMLKALAD